MTDPCSICGMPTDPLGQCERHSDAGVVRLLEHFDPQPIEPGYLGEEISQLMYDAAATIRRQAEKIRNLETRISDIKASEARFNRSVNRMYRNALTAFPDYRD